MKWKKKDIARFYCGLAIGFLFYFIFFFKIPPSMNDIPTGIIGIIGVIFAHKAFDLSE